MGRYIAQRLLQLPPVLLGVLTIVFFMIHAIPGDPVRVMLGEHATPEQIKTLREKLGLDRPIWEQYFKFLVNALRGDLGRSIRTHNPVVLEVANAFPATVELALFAMVWAIVIGLPAGIISAVFQYSAWDYTVMFLALVGISMPVFWLGLVLMMMFSVNLGWFPISGRLSPEVTYTGKTGFYILESLFTGKWGILKDALAHIFLPSLALSTIPMAVIARITRASMLEVLRQDYIRTARAKGVSEAMVVLKHALKNALVPVITVIGLQFGYLLAGAVLTETIFAWPGVGRLAVEAIFARDVPVVQGVTLLVATTFVLVNLLVDIIYAWIDPRIRF